MGRFQNGWTATVLVVAVLILGSLVVGSVAWLAGATRGTEPVVQEGGGTSVVGDSTVAGAAPQAPDPSAEEPAAPSASAPVDGPSSHGVIGPDVHILPMPPRPVDGSDIALLKAEDPVLPTQMMALITQVLGDGGLGNGAAADVGLDVGFQDGTVDDEEPRHPYVSRAQAAAVIVKALGLDEVARSMAPTEAIFRDVPPAHPAFASVALLEALGLYPFHSGTFFAPDDAVPWAELKHTVEAAAALDMVQGPVVHVNGPARTLSVEWTPRHAIAYIVGDDTVLVRNGHPVSLEQVRPADQVQGIADKDGFLHVAVVVGGDGDNDMSNELLALVRELATPEQLAAIIARDWDRAAVELKGSLYEQLLARGATPEEAEALLAQDWATIEERSKARLTELISDQTDVDEALVRAILDQDWDAALGFIEVEVLEYVLNYLAV